MSENKTPEKKAPAKKKIVSASTGKEMSKEDIAQAKKENAKVSQAVAAAQTAPEGKSKKLRLGAVLLWIAAIGCEVLAVLALGRKLPFLSSLKPMWGMIIFLVLDLILLVLGSQLWKKANHIAPISGKNKVKFWIWNNMGIIVAAIAFIPFIVLLLLNKEADGKTKAIVSVVAVIALVLGGFAGYDRNPLSWEQMQAASADEHVGQGVYWITTGGTVYHIDQECFTLNNTEDLKFGTVGQAAEEGHTRLCYYCAKRYDVSNEVGIEAQPETVQEDTTVLEDENPEIVSDEGVSPTEAPAEEKPAA